LNESGARTFVHHPILEARHWAIVGGKDVEKGSYHRTHSGYAVAAFHEALRLTLKETVAARASSYGYHEKALRGALEYMGCKVTSNMTSLVVFNLPIELEGQEMELVQTCREQGFGIWPTLSQPVQVRIGILNQISQHAVTEIVRRFALVLYEAGAPVTPDAATDHLRSFYKTAPVAA
jgi:aspartate aminotransferase-like enzyme